MKEQYTIIVNEDNLEQFTENLKLARGINVVKGIVNFREFICGGTFKQEGAVVEVSLTNRNPNGSHLFHNAVLEATLSYDEETEWVRLLTGKKPQRYTTIDQFIEYHKLAGTTTTTEIGYLAIHAVAPAVDEYLREKGFRKTDTHLYHH